jgi:hypothetical protein
MRIRRNGGWVVWTTAALVVAIAATAARAQDNKAEAKPDDATVKKLDDVGKKLDDVLKRLDNLEKGQAALKAKGDTPPPMPVNPADALPAAAPGAPVPAAAVPMPNAAPVAPAVAAPGDVTVIAGSIRDQLLDNLKQVDEFNVAAFKIKNAGKVLDAATRTSQLKAYVDGTVRNKFVKIYTTLTKKTTLAGPDRAEVDKMIAEVVGDPNPADPVGPVTPPVKPPASGGTLIQEIEAVAVDATEVSMSPNATDIQSLVVDSGQLFGNVLARCQARRQARVLTSGTVGRGVILTRPVRSARYVIVN